jgi:hypothetical protein
VMIGLPGTRFVPSDFESRSLGGGDCLYNAIGNSMQNAGVSLFGPKTRNLAKKVKDMIAREIDNNKATKEAMNCRRGYWTTSEISRPEDYVKKNLIAIQRKHGGPATTCTYLSVRWKNRVATTESSFTRTKQSNMFIFLLWKKMGKSRNSSSMHPIYAQMMLLS